MKPENSVPGIYYYKNKINGKLYIGQAQNLHKRHNDIRYEGYAGQVFNNAIKKYGIENFEYGILTHCKVEELDKFEVFYIKRLRSKVPNGYNMTEGGEGVRGLKWDEERKEKHRIMMVGEGNPNFGNKWNEEQRKRASEYAKEVTRRRGGFVCIHTPEIVEKSYNTLVINKYGKTLEEIDEMIKKHINNGGSTSYTEISKLYGFSVKTISLSFGRLGLENERSVILKNSHKHNPYLVQCDRLNHNIVLNVFPSLKEAVEKTSIKSIHHCTHGVQENAGGYFWRYNKDGEVPSETYNEDYLKPLPNSRILTEEQKRVLLARNYHEGKHLWKKVYCFNSSNELIDVCDSVVKAAEKHGINKGVITDICNYRRKNKYINGVTFSYDKNHKVEPLIEVKIYQYTTDGRLIKEYNSIGEASKETGALESSISSCVSGKYKTASGFVWKKEIKEVK